MFKPRPLQKTRLLMSDFKT